MTESIQSVRHCLQEYLATGAPTLLTLEPWGPDLHKRLSEYAERGKMVRGALVTFAYRLFDPDGSVPPACCEAGVAMELLQSFLLIHDDIMDQDDLRRGVPAVHSQYRELMKSHPGAKQYGLSMGICGGDVAAFLAMERIATLSVPPELRSELSALVAREVVSVGLAQMQDVHHGYVSEVDREAILKVYTYKTGRYTFSLPLMVGARIAGASLQQASALARIGEHLGRIFQIRDDQLGIFGRSEEIGKPAGSDIREDKKTIFREELFRTLPQNHVVRSYFGSPLAGEAEMEIVRQEIIRTGVLDRINDLVAEEEQRVNTLVGELEIPPEGVAALNALALYNDTRRT
ncbi:MAG: polyprenyl synthetase family protein [Spirochaetaceae bacterium]|nr:MAG: polyprenyl synthetase family protein [Spirochaetaceae bacterium]